MEGKLTGLVMIIMWVPTVNTYTHTHTVWQNPVITHYHTMMCVFPHPTTKSGCKRTWQVTMTKKAMSESVRRLIKGGGKGGKREKQRDGEGGRGGICLWLVLRSAMDRLAGGFTHTHIVAGPPFPKIFLTCTS